MHPFTARRCLARHMLSGRVSVNLYVCPSAVGVLPRRLNTATSLSPIDAEKHIRRLSCPAVRPPQLWNIQYVAALLVVVHRPGSEAVPPMFYDEPASALDRALDPT